MNSDLKIDCDDENQFGQNFLGLVKIDVNSKIYKFTKSTKTPFCGLFFVLLFFLIFSTGFPTKLEDYMNLNNELDKDIMGLTLKIKKSRHNINHQDDDVEKKLAMIRSKQIDIFKLRNSQVEEEIELNKRKAKIDTMDEQLVRYDQERKELELKIANVTGDIRHCEGEIQADQAAVDRIRPEREELEKERRRRVIKHDQEIRVMLSGRKKFSVPGGFVKMSWKRPEKAENGWKWPKLTVLDQKWPLTRKRSESRFLTRKWPQMSVFTKKYEISRKPPCILRRRNHGEHWFREN